MCRLTHYLPRIANAGGVLLLTDVVHECARRQSPFHEWTLRRSALALVSLTTFAHTVTRVVRGGGARALAAVLELLQRPNDAMADLEGPLQPLHDTVEEAPPPPGLTTSMVADLLTRLQPDAVTFKVAVALARCLAQPDDADLAASAGACRALASIMLHHDDQTRRTSVTALCNAFCTPETAQLALAGGAIRSMADGVVSDFREEKPLYVLGLFNATCDTHVCAAIAADPGLVAIVVDALLTMVTAALDTLEAAPDAEHVAEPDGTIDGLLLPDGGPAHPTASAPAVRVLAYSLAALRNLSAIDGATHLTATPEAVKVLHRVLLPRATVGFTSRAPLDVVNRAYGAVGAFGACLALAVLLLTPPTPCLLLARRHCPVPPPQRVSNQNSHQNNHVAATGAPVLHQRRSALRRKFQHRRASPNGAG